MQYRTRKILSSKLRRAVRWEFWPMSVFYLPIVLYILWLIFRYRSLPFLSVNPGLPMSGLIGERKAATLAQLDGSEFLARFRLLSTSLDVGNRVHQAQQFMLELDLTYPVILKPDFGQRGQDVAVIRDEFAMRDYFSQVKSDVLIQEHIEGEEFGVFYLRYPNDATGSIFSITEKTFPVVVGDGEKDLEQLLMENPRTHYMAQYLLELHDDKLEQVLELDEPFKVVEIGSHCRGSVFLDGSDNITDELTQAIDRISKKIDGFYFGRYDLRVGSVTQLKQGKGFKILEVNGLTSESTNIYDPKNSVMDAYKILFKQWRKAFEIGQQNIDRNVDKVSLKDLLNHLRRTYC